jgi:hypothetical protein
MSNLFCYKVGLLIGMLYKLREKESIIKGLSAYEDKQLFNLIKEIHKLSAE